jgi:hypothetical protein
MLLGLLMLASGAVQGQEQRYRVELLVLRHLEGYSATQPVAVLQDFSAALDLLAPDLLPPATANTLPETAAQPEPLAVLQETPGEVMQQAWRHLRGSNGLRPEVYLSWEQAGHELFPLLRIHNQVQLLQDEPYLDAQNTARLQPAGSAGTAAGNTQEGAGAVSGETLPPHPVRFYQIDGTARLRVSRFLHLDLDIQYREPMAEAAHDAVAHDGMAQTPQLPGSTQSGLNPAVATSYQVHAIRQSRQVRIQDMEYFDGPVIAVLALITRVDALPEGAAPATPEANQPSKAAETGR